MITNDVKNLRSKRNGTGVSQGQMAMRLGVCRSYICRLEQGQLQPSAEMMFRIAQYFGCHIEDVFHHVPDNKGMRG